MKIEFINKGILSALAISLICTNTFAQKLPSIQASSVFAPTNIKIDGKPTEWDNKFQAYNNHIECYYTVANDNNNLYLTVQVVSPAITRRIINGGITFAVNKSGKKNDRESARVTFPLFENGNRFTPQFRGKMVMSAGAPVSFSGGGGGMAGVTMITTSGSAISASSSQLSLAQSDSLMNINNTNFSAKAKNIGVKGISGVDSLISVYNDDGIKAVAGFDNKFVYTYELCVPIKSLGLDIKNTEKFAYHVTINEVEQQGINIVGDASDPSKIKSINISAGAQMGQPATDFWGEYTLAKK